MPFTGINGRKTAYSLAFAGCGGIEFLAIYRSNGWAGAMFQNFIKGMRGEKRRDVRQKKQV
ncbi:MAG: hypothetical protein C4548_04020 [Desulfobacteraceae bacterium]|nr:MAG: hypothetical protein C4548_04020 [Desulfobacteraceae bacterium]